MKMPILTGNEELTARMFLREILRQVLKKKIKARC